MRDEDFYVRWAGVVALGSIGVEAKAAVPALQELLLKEKDVVLRRALVEALGKIAPELQVANVSDSLERPAAWDDLPQGHFLLKLEQVDDALVNVLIHKNQARFVDSTNPYLVGGSGQFRRDHDARFFIAFTPLDHTMSQTWVFGEDGRARVIESPDRGEMQFAVPARDHRLQAAAE